MSNIQIGLSTAAIGIVVVFFGLIILIGMIYLMTAFTRRIGNKNSGAAAPEKAPVPAPVPAAAEEAEEEDDQAVIAAITAAIACVWQESGENSGFVVRRIRRIQNSPAWQRSGREEQVLNRF